MLADVFQSSHVSEKERCMVFVIQIVITSLILLLMAKIVKGVEIDNWGSALFAAVVLGLVHAFVKPVMVWLTIPLTVVTM